jgi:hypothetical protein
MSDYHYPEFPCCGGIVFHRGGHKCDEYRNPAQPMPKPAEGPAIWDLVMADMGARDRVGTQRYGQRLMANDGRDALRDAYEEAMDLAVYLRKCMFERDGR